MKPALFICASVLTTMWSAHASTVSVNFGTDSSGADLGAQVPATLEMSDAGNGIQFTLFNNGAGTTEGGFITSLYLGVSEDLSASALTREDGVLIASYTINGNPKAAPGDTEFNIQINWSGSDSNDGLYRFDSGEYSSFSISGLSFDTLLDSNDFQPFALVQFQGSNSALGNDGDSFFTAELAPVPLPGALFLMATGLGVIGARRIRRRQLDSAALLK